MDKGLIVHPPAPDDIFVGRKGAEKEGAGLVAGDQTVGVGLLSFQDNLHVLEWITRAAEDLSEYPGPVHGLDLKGGQAYEYRYQVWQAFLPVFLFYLQKNSPGQVFSLDA